MLIGIVTRSGTQKVFSPQGVIIKNETNKPILNNSIDLIVLFGYPVRK